MLPVVSYPDMRSRQRLGVELRGQCSPQLNAERTTREVNSILIASIRMGDRNDDKGNTCELLINAVKWSKPKVLIGLDQKVRGMDSWLYIPVTQSGIPSADRQAQLSPLSSGKRPVREADR